LQLCGLHDPGNKRVFDSIIVVTDRRVLDKQLQDTITQFDHVKGTVVTIKKDKAKSLSAALQSGKDIIVCTLQTFPFAVDMLSEMSGKHFAVVIDEAHSSQSGEGADSVKKILGASDLECEEQEEEPEDEEDLVNYTTLKVYFNLLKTIEDDPRYSKKKGMQLLKDYVDKHDHSIRTKTAIMVEHFREQVMNRIDGQAKAMLVTKSRASAVRYKLAFDRYINTQEYPFKVLVAFSGTVDDQETGREFTEAGMNGFPEAQTAEIFKHEDYRILIVANKFQTGFDQPLLHTMYVDKRLGGVNAVQTLSRLNRKHLDKEDTMVLDFENEADLIQRSFQPYYEKTLLTEATDPNKLYDLEYELKEYHIFEDEDVENFAREYFSPKGKQEKLHSILSPVVDRYLGKPKEEQHDFRTLVKKYVRLYSYLSHVIPFKDVDLEKLYQFLRHLHRKLPVSGDRLPVEIIENINMDSYRIQQTSSGKIALADEEGRLGPTRKPEAFRRPEEELAPLSIIIQEINERFGADFTEEDKVKHFAEDMQRRLVENDKLARAADPKVNTRDNFKLIFNDYFDDVLNDMIDSNIDIYTKINDDIDFGNIFKKALFESVYRYLIGKKKKDSSKDNF
jgi:type I restriction enzyme, R subunit